MNSRPSESFAFVEGPIDRKVIVDLLEKFSTDTSIGAHSIFIGQIRRDKVENSEVMHLNYSANETVAEQEFSSIHEELAKKFDIKSTHVIHSLGDVPIGEMCLVVIVGTAHRNECQSAVDWLVEAVKNRLPIFAKEVLKDNSYIWKVNTPKAVY